MFLTWSKKKKIQYTPLTSASSNKIHFTGDQIRTISSKMLLVPVLLRVVDLLEERGARTAGGEAAGGVAVAMRLFIVVQETLAVDGGVEADVFVVQDEDNKGVCVEAVVVQGLEAENGD